MVDRLQRSDLGIHEFARFAIGRVSVGDAKNEWPSPGLTVMGLEGRS